LVLSLLLSLLLCVNAIPFGTPEQLQWAKDEMGCFIHWNMATAAGTQGCPRVSQLTHQVATVTAVTYHQSLNGILHS